MPQVAVLRDGLREARDNLERAKKTQEKLAAAKQAAQEETDRLESQVGGGTHAAALRSPSVLFTSADRAHT